MLHNACLARSGRSVIFTLHKAAELDQKINTFKICAPCEPEREQGLCGMLRVSGLRVSGNSTMSDGLHAFVGHRNKWNISFYSCLWGFLTHSTQNRRQSVGLYRSIEQDVNMKQ